MRRLSSTEVVVALVFNILILPGTGTILFGQKRTGLIQALLVVSSASLVSASYLLEVIHRSLPQRFRTIPVTLKLPDAVLFVLSLILVGVWVWTVVQTLALIRRWAKRRKES